MPGPITSSNLRPWRADSDDPASQLAARYAIAPSSQRPDLFGRLYPFIQPTVYAAVESADVPGFGRDDLAQEAFCRIPQALLKYHPDLGSVHHYVFVVAYRVGVDLFRASRAEKRMAGEWPQPASLDAIEDPGRLDCLADVAMGSDPSSRLELAEASLDADAVGHHARRMFGIELSGDQRQILQLRAADVSVAEIAERTGRSRWAVYYVLRQIRDKIATQSPGPRSE